MVQHHHRSPVKQAPWAPAWVALACVSFMAAVLCWVNLRLGPPSTPAPVDSDRLKFSEGRARAYLDHLVGLIGDRQVSMPGLQQATEYMLQQAEVLKAIAANRTDLSVEVVKITASGAAAMTFTRINFTNAYRDLDSVALVVTPKGSEDLKGLIIASHYDSAVCSTGASDDGAQVAVMLEVARAVLVGNRLPATPVIFLWTGGEEPISPAAHGFATQSELYHRAGAFINLEAMGGGGVPIVFQHTGEWLLKAYARGCPLPRGSRVAQDIFDLHIIPADSDFRMFSARHYGSLPGLDIAFLLDSTAYHSYLDTPERVRPGVIQEVGDALMGGLFTVCEELRNRQTNPQPPLTAQQSLKDAQETAVFFDVLGYGMVIYSDDMAKRLHTLPPIILLSLPLLTYPPARPALQKLLKRAYLEMFLATGRALLSILLGVGLPIAVGVGRTLLTGKPMVWFANHWYGYIQFLPAAAAGALLPWLGLGRRIQQAAPLHRGGFMAAQVQGSTLAASLIGAGLTLVGMRGNAMIFAIDGTLGVLASLLITNTTALSLGTLAWVCALSLVPMAVGGSVVAVFIAVMMERMALSGFVHAVLGDVVVAALSGLGVLATTCGVFLPLLGASIRGYQKRLVGLLLTVSLLGAAWTSTQPAYAPHAPKRVVISHLFQTQQDASAPAASGSSVAMQVVEERVSVAGIDSTGLEQVVDMSQFQPLLPPNGREYTPLFPLDTMLHGFAAPITVMDRATQGSEGGTAAKPQGTTIDRAQRYCTSVATAGRGCNISAPGLQEPSVTPAVSQLPYVKLLNVTHRDEGVVRLQLEMVSQLPCWGMLNVTAPGLVAWSFTDHLMPSEICTSCGAARQHMVRFTTQSPNPGWPFWIDIDTKVDPVAHTDTQLPTSFLGSQLSTTSPFQQAEGGTSSSPDSTMNAVDLAELVGLVRIELSVSYLHRTPVLRRVLGMLPGFTAETWLATVYQSYWSV